MARLDLMKAFPTADTSRRGKLNLENAINEGRERVQGHPGHSLKVSHMIEIADNHDQDLFHCMGDVFFLGVRQGYRIAQKERKNHDKK